MHKIPSLCLFFSYAGSLFITPSLFPLLHSLYLKGSRLIFSLEGELKGRKFFWVGLGAERKISEMAQQDKHFSSFSTTHFSIWGIDETKLPSKDCAAPPSIPM
ncbi:Uncharacterized protein TCM_000887 [Theobroma cacao]|uniref:Uncharacterized protein n=1 Tax=Theobroma cacao TaxID=3641 RepID=A0A061DPD4_THECC|nr:Uncharacterized protein TCM_000887 [Theobroma cacao]